MKNKLKYKGKVYGKRHVINNIKREFDKSDELSTFYEEALSWCKQVADEAWIPLIKVVGVLAASSPQKDWELNKRIAYNILVNGEFKGQTGLQLRKAKQILFYCDNDVEQISTVLGGPKTIRFFKNIYLQEESDCVTIDRHAVNIGINKREYSGLSLMAYRFFEMCYKKAAEEIGVMPYILQATTWESWRERNSRKQTI